MASGQALAYLTDYSTLQYYQTQLDCRLVVRWPCRSPHTPTTTRKGALHCHASRLQALQAGQPSQRLPCRFHAYGSPCSQAEHVCLTKASLQVASDPFGPGNLALGLRKGSPYKAALNKAMITLRGNGFIDVLRRQWLPADFCSDSGSHVRCWCKAEGWGGGGGLEMAAFTTSHAAVRVSNRDLVGDPCHGHVAHRGFIAVLLAGCWRDCGSRGGGGFGGF